MRTLTAALTIVITAACCLAQQPVAVLQIDSFERDDALAAWELRETMAGETVREHATDGERAIRLDYPAYEQGSEQWPAAILNAGSGLLPSDWTGYEQLLCDIYVEADHAPQLRGQINAGGQKGQKTFTIDPGEPTTIAIDLQGLSSFLDLTEVEQLHLYMTRPTRPATVYVDNIRLAAYTISAEGLRFIADPFGGGKVGVAGRLSRAGQWRIGVVSEDDVTVAVDAGEGEDIDWRWDALTDEGLAAAPGIYRVIARIADPQRPGVRPEIAQIGEFELAAEAARHDMLVWSEPTTKKVMLHDRPETPEGVGWWSWAGLTSPMGYRIFDEPAMLARVGDGAQRGRGSSDRHTHRRTGAPALRGGRADTRGDRRGVRGRDRDPTGGLREDRTTAAVRRGLRRLVAGGADPGGADPRRRDDRGAP
jgi:hypothetical protein